jgi:hypothetical protein
MSWAGLRRLVWVRAPTFAQDTHLRVLPHRAGVDDDQVRLILVAGKAKAHLIEKARSVSLVGLVSAGSRRCPRGQWVWSQAPMSRICAQISIWRVFFPWYLHAGNGMRQGPFR